MVSIFFFLKRRTNLILQGVSFAKVDKSYQGLSSTTPTAQVSVQVRGLDGAAGRDGRLLEGLEHEELLEDLGLAGLPDLPRQEHLIHHRVHL